MIKILAEKIRDNRFLRLMRSNQSGRLLICGVSVLASSL
jgi:hypothetical protein